MCFLLSKAICAFRNSAVCCSVALLRAGRLLGLEARCIRAFVRRVRFQLVFKIALSPAAIFTRRPLSNLSKRTCRVVLDKDLLPSLPVTNVLITNYLQHYPLLILCKCKFHVQFTLVLYS